MSENVKCTHIPRVRVEVDHEGMDMSWLECVVCGNRLYVSDEPVDSLRTQLAAAEERAILYEKAWHTTEDHVRQLTAEVEEWKKKAEIFEQQVEHLANRIKRGQDYP